MNDALPSPVEVMKFLDRAAIELDAIGKRLEAAHIAYGDAQVAWEQENDIALLEIVEEYEQRGERVPAADIREAMARKRTGFQTYADYRKSKRLVEAIEGRVRRIETAVTARQSTLKRMEAEATGRTFDPKTGEVYG